MASTLVSYNSSILTQQLGRNSETVPAEMECSKLLYRERDHQDISVGRGFVKYVKNVLNDSNSSKIVINSSKPKAVYFQCTRRSGFRIKDASRDEVAYTKRNKCAYQINLYPKGQEAHQKGEDSSIDDKQRLFWH